MLSILERWYAERDAVAFLNLVVAESDRAKNTIDLCREILQFVQDHIEKHKEIRSYIVRNSDNFDLLDVQHQDWVEKLKKIISDPQPWHNMPSYNKLRREIDAVISSKRDALRTDISNNYSKVFDDLHKVAQSTSADESILPSKDSVVDSKTASDSLATLQLNCNTDDFYDLWVARLTAPPQPVSTQPVSAQPISAQQVAAPVVRRISLDTRNTSRLTTQSDVEAYLDGLRRQLMKYIDNGETVMVVK